MIKGIKQKPKMPVIHERLQTSNPNFRLKERLQRDPRLRERLRELRKKQEPEQYLDILSIIEHPAFIDYYETELAGAIAETKILPKADKVVGDIISVSLKDDYKNYDFFWPIIIHDKEEHIKSEELSFDNLESFPIKLEDLKPLVNRDGDLFYSQEALIVKTKFGEYSVTADIFTAKSYNSFLQKVVNAVSEVPVRIGKKSVKTYPVMQINTALIAQLVDEYIRHKLFAQEFDPLLNNNWKILILTQEGIIQHIVRNVSKSIYDLQNKFDVVDAKVIKRYFSEISELKIRNTFGLNVAKTIFDRIQYPSNKGGFEKAFIEFVDSDSKVNSFIKIYDHYYDFANIIYIRKDGLLAHYYPDFLVKIKDIIYLVETKSDKDINTPDVQQKRLATIDWVNKVNQLNSEDKMNAIWKYVLLDETTFYSFRDKGGNTQDILEYAIPKRTKIEGKLEGYI